MRSLILVTLLISSTGMARATEDPGDVVNGVYVGHRVGSDDKVTIELRGASMVVLDPNTVSVGRVDGWAIAGPGTKTGGLQFKAEVAAISQTTRAGKTRPVKAGPKSFMRLHLAPDTAEAGLCLTAPGSKVPAPTRVPSRGASQSEPGATCFELTRVWRPAAALVPVEPAVNPQCVAVCVTRTQMKGVGAEQVEADCRAECAK